MLFTSSLMSLAHSIRRNDSALSWSECIKTAIKASSLKDALRNSVLSITFEKADGTTTTRTATLLSDFLPAPRIGGNVSKKKRTSPKVTFWSIDDGGFRSFLPSRLIGWKVYAATMQAAA